MNFAIYLPWDHAQLELVQELSNRHRNFKILLVPGMKNKPEKCRTSSVKKTGYLLFLRIILNFTKFVKKNIMKLKFEFTGKNNVLFFFLALCPI